MYKLLPWLAALLWMPAAQPQNTNAGLIVSYGNAGIASISYNGVSLENLTSYPQDAFTIGHIQSTTTNSTTPNGSGDLGYGQDCPTKTWNGSAEQWTYTCSWGTIAVTFSTPGNNALNTQVTVTNNSNSGEIIDGADIFPYVLHFPNNPNKYSGATFGGYAQFDAATANAPIYVADYGTGIATEVGLAPYATISPSSTGSATQAAIYQGWNLASNSGAYSGNTDANGNYVYTPIMTTTPPTGGPNFLRAQYARLQPGTSMTYSYSVRFTNEGTQANVADAAGAYTSVFPQILNWTDRRVIASAYLASNNSGGNGIGPVGPTGCGNNSADANNWKFGGQPLCNISTVFGQQFQDQILNQGHSNAINAEALNAQAVCTWDIEGQKFPQDTSYVGSPDQVATLAPEMEQAVTDTNFNGSSSAVNSTSNGGDGVDYTGTNPATNKTYTVSEAYFKQQTNAGFRVCVTLRPDLYKMYTVSSTNDTAINNFPGDGMDDATTNNAAVQILDTKARYANSRWGVTIFYVDSMVYSNGAVMNESVIDQVAQDNPTFLFEPEALAGQWHSRQLRSTAMFDNFEDNKDYGTLLDFPFDPRLVYPKGFSVNNINEGGPYSLDSTSTPIIQAAVNNGDVLMDHADYVDPQQSKVNAIEKASTYSGGSSPNPAPSPTTPTLSFANIPNPQEYPQAAFPVFATSASSGNVTYSIQSGPATISGNSLTTTGLGTVVVAASQAASGNYTSATTTDSFSVVAAPTTPTLTFASVPTQTYPEPSFAVSATSASQGQVTYAVASGPATLNGNSVTLTGTGSVTIQATQAASGNYNSATASLTFAVTAAPSPQPSSGKTTPPTTTGNTWYVRPDGGTRYSANQTSGQCDGLGDAPYPGTGTNQHCAFNDFRYLYGDGSYANSTTSAFPAYGWIGAGGDVYFIRGSLASGNTYRIGWNNNANAYDNPTSQFWGIAGDPYSSYIPAPPAGTSAQPTRILGENYGSCSAQNSRVQLHGGYGLYTVLNMVNTSYVDMECFDVTEFSNCSLEGSATTPCNANIGSLTDHAKAGITFNNAASNITLNNVRVHGISGNGWSGPTGPNFLATNVDIIGNAIAGWNSDDGSGTVNATGRGSTLIQNFSIQWNGCKEEYPIVDAQPYAQCTDDNAGGYGDGFGTATVLTPSPGWQVHFDNGTVRYNTQDGLDALHLVGPGSSMTITRVLSYGNMGQQIKVGGESGTANNDIVVGNCNALRQQIPGTPGVYFTGTLTSGSATITNVANVTGGTLAVGQPVSLAGGVYGPIPISTFITAVGNGTVTMGNSATASATNASLSSAYNSELTDFCRAADTTMEVTLGKNSSLTLQNNTILSAGAVGIEVDCDTTNGACDSSSLTNYQNNIFLGFPNNTADGYLPGTGQRSNPLYDNTGLFGTTPGSVWKNNLTFGGSSACPMAGENNALCVDPQLANETWNNYAFGNVTPLKGSPVIGAGAFLNNIPLDFNGGSRPNPPSIGAIEFATNTPQPTPTPTPTTTPTLTFAPISTQTYPEQTFLVTATSASSGAVSYSVQSGPAMLSGNSVTLTGTGTVVLAANQTASGSYTSASTTISFNVVPAAPIPPRPFLFQGFRNLQGMRPPVTP